MVSYRYDPLGSRIEVNDNGHITAGHHRGSASASLRTAVTSSMLAFTRQRVTNT